MNTVRWLQISDFHLQESRNWEQDVVLSSLCRKVEELGANGQKIDFILVTGDLVYSGQRKQFELAARFLDNLSVVTHVARERFYSIPGNHDVVRSVQKTCFLGARSSLQSQNAIDDFIGDKDEVKTLLKRLDNFYRFQTGYSAGQDRQWSTGRLGYTSFLEVGDLLVAVIGLNTSWLAEGGLSDHGRLLMGERQVIDLIDIAQTRSPNIIVSMGHHPFQVLNDYDRRVVQKRIDGACHFYHCGHLHDPETREINSRGSRCLNVAAGATYETRQSHNAFSLVELDLERCESNLFTFKYAPSEGTFSYHRKEVYPLSIASNFCYNVADLGQAIASKWPEYESFAYYVAALLCEVQAEIPFVIENRYFFTLTRIVLEESSDQYRDTTQGFQNVANLIKIYGKKYPPSSFLVKYGQGIGAFCEHVSGMRLNNPDFDRNLLQRDTSARSYGGVATLRPFANTIALLDELALAAEWNKLKELAERHLLASDASLARHARRMLGLAFSRSGLAGDLELAIDVYKDIVEGQPEPTDFAGYAQLLLRYNKVVESKEIILEGIRNFPKFFDIFQGAVQEIVETTGDRKFRDKVQALRNDGAN